MNSLWLANIFGGLGVFSSAIFYSLGRFARFLGLSFSIFAGAFLCYTLSFLDGRDPSFLVRS